VVLPLHLTLNIIQMMISLQLVHSLGVLDQGGGGGSSDAHVVANQKILDFLGGNDEDDISFLLLEKYLLQIEDI
jgi:hypothetical protein